MRLVRFCAASSRPTISSPFRFLLKIKSRLFTNLRSFISRFCHLSDRRAAWADRRAQDLPAPATDAKKAILVTDADLKSTNRPDHCQSLLQDARSPISTKKSTTIRRHRKRCQPDAPDHNEFLTPPPGGVIIFGFFRCWQFTASVIACRVPIK